MSHTPRIGELLVTAGLISQQQLQDALTSQNGESRLGALLVNRGYVSEIDLTQILSRQLSVAWVSLRHVDFTPELLRLISVDLAERHVLIPVHTRPGDDGAGILYVAMDDPTNVTAMEQVSRYTGMHVRPLIAPPSEIRRAIREQYEIAD